MQPDYVARFWSRVNKSDGFWLWTRGRTTAGYGLFTVVKAKPAFVAKGWQP
ncbi:MAG: hypothetical protein ACRCU1_03540 [Alsobacter sp.]